MAFDLSDDSTTSDVSVVQYPSLKYIEHSEGVSMDRGDVLPPPSADRIGKTATARYSDLDVFFLFTGVAGRYTFGHRIEAATD